MNHDFAYFLSISQIDNIKIKPSINRNTIVNAMKEAEIASFISHQVAHTNQGSFGLSFEGRL